MSLQPFGARTVESRCTLKKLLINIGLAKSRWKFTEKETKGLMREDQFKFFWPDKLQAARDTDTVCPSQSPHHTGCNADDAFERKRTQAVQRNAIRWEQIRASRRGASTSGLRARVSMRPLHRLAECKQC